MVDLINTLHKQALALPIPFEICVFDDASASVFRHANQPIRQLSFVKYVELPKNRGRSAIRNHLARQAQGSRILFLDADVTVTNKEFLKNYITRPANQVVFGGLTYKKPDGKKTPSLRYFYGRCREELSPAERAQKPYLRLKMCNVQLPKRIFENITFDESITQYGYEDYLFAKKLAEASTPVIHIVNPVIISDSESTRDFLEKTEEAVQTLHNLINEKKITADDAVKLSRMYFTLKKWRLNRFVGLLATFFKPLLLHNLTSGRPALYVFDFYRLGLLCSK